MATYAPLLPIKPTADSATRTQSRVLVTVESQPSPRETNDYPFHAVQFSAPIYYADEEEGHLIVDVMRLGRLEGEVSVTFETHDVSATAEHDYKAHRAKLVFASGERHKDVRVELVPNESWKQPLEFKVKLVDPVACSVGVHTHTARVKIIDRSVFPGDHFNEFLRAGDDLKAQIKSIWPMLLFWEFSKLVFRSAGVGTLTLVTLALDQMANLYKLLLVYTSVYLVNVALNEHHPHHAGKPDRSETLYIIGAIYVVPLVALHLWDYCKQSLQLEARIVAWLRIGLFRKFLNYSTDSRESVQAGVISLALHTDAEDAAAGYSNLLDLFRSAGSIVLSMYFAFQQAQSCLWIVFLVPALTLLWAGFREEAYLKMSGTAVSTAHMISFFQDAFTKLEFYDAYRKRSMVSDMFEERVETVKIAGQAKPLFLLNTVYFTTWLGPGLSAIFICMEGPQVLAGELSLGAFLAALKVIQDVVHNCMTAYHQYSGVSKTFKPLGRITFLLNCPTNTLAEKAHSRWRRDATRKKDASCSDDSLQIELRDVTFVSRQGRKILENCNAELEQGKIIMITGGHGSGKTTLARMMGGKFHPQTGSIFIPSHLRVLYVAQDPVLLKTSTYGNLIFGLPVGRRPDHRRIEAILNRLEMFETLRFAQEDLSKAPVANDDLSAFQASPSDVAWLDVLSRAERCLLHLARALISDPEVMVMSKPLVHYFHETEDRVLAVLREYVDQRGFLMPEESKMSRRPRTLIFTSMEDKHTHQADAVWRLGQWEKGSSSHPGSSIKSESLRA